MERNHSSGELTSLIFHSTARSTEKNKMQQSSPFPSSSVNPLQVLSQILRSQVKSPMNLEIFKSSAPLSTEISTSVCLITSIKCQRHPTQTMATRRSETHGRTAIYHRGGRRHVPHNQGSSETDPPERYKLMDHHHRRCTSTRH